MNPRLLPRIVGLLCIALGVSVLLGWWLHMPALVQLIEGEASVAPNSALGFVLLGLTQLLPDTARFRTMRLAAAGAVVIGNCIVLLQHVFGWNTGIDTVLLTPWVDDANPFPGRMAAPTSICFLIAGLFVWTIPYVRIWWISLGMQIALFMLTLISSTCLLGYLLDMPLLYSWYLNTAMALQTSACFTLVAVTLWMQWSRQVKLTRFYYDIHDQRINLFGSSILVVAILFSGFAAFMLMAEQNERMRFNSLKVEVDGKAEAVLRLVREERHDLNSLLRVRPELTVALAAGPVDQPRLLENMQAFVDDRVTALAVLRDDGRPLAQRGRFATADFHARIGPDTELLWTDGPLLRQRAPLEHRGRRVGYLLIERRMPHLQEVFAPNPRLGTSAESGMCHRLTPDVFSCIPTRFRPYTFRQPASINGRLSPMGYALSGQQRFVTTRDYRKHAVVAAVRPLPEFGLGLVTKMNSDEFYEPIGARLKDELILMAILLTLGVTVLRWLVTPLVERLADSEDRFRSFIEATQDWVWACETGGRLTYSNAGLERLLGYTPEEAAGASLLLLVHPDDKAPLQDVLNDLGHRDATWSLTLRFRHRDGRWRYFRCVGHAQMSRAGKMLGFRGVNHDISDLKQAEDDLRRSRKMLELVLDTVPQRVFWKDLDLNYLGANKAFAEHAGVASPQDLIGKSDFELAWRNEAEILRADDRTVIATGDARYNYEETQLTAAGTTLWYRTSKVPLRDESGNIIGILGTTEDITAAKRGEEQRWRAEHRFKQLIASAPVGIVETDEHGGCIMVNERWCQLTGLSPEEAAGDGWASAVHPDDRDRVVLAWRQALAEKRGLHVIDFRYRTKQGVTVWVKTHTTELRNPAGLLTGYLGTVTDISNMKRAEADLYQQRSFLDSIVENIPAMVFVKDAENLRFVLLNRAGESLLGYSREQLLGKSDLDFFPREQAERFLAHDRDVIGCGQLKDIPEEIIHTADGEERVLHTRKIPVFDANGAPLYLLGISEDITERRRASRIKDEFISVVSHELRTPLTSIDGALEILDIGAAGSLSERGQKFVRIARENSLRLVRLINDILDIDKIESGHYRLDMQPVDLQTVVRQAVDGTADFAVRHDVRLQLAPWPGPLTAMADPDRLIQVLTNLISNAVKYSPASGVVTIEARQIMGWARLSVIDHGSGIAEEFKQRIFSKFSQADSSTVRKKQGTGLGLTIVKALVERMGGSIGYVSEPHVKTIFYVDLQLAAEGNPK